MAEMGSTTLESPEADPTIKNFLRILIFGLFLMLVGVALQQIGVQRRVGATLLPVLPGPPAFTLCAQDGRAFDSGQLKGKVWVADFIFTRCAGPCPMMTLRMAHLQESLRAKSDVRFVSITVDPDFDTPEVLCQYAQSFNVNSNQWFFLTGSYESIEKLALEGFKLTVQKQGDMPGGEKNPILHSSHFVLVDQVGRIRGYYDGEVPDRMNALRKDIEWLLRDGASKS